MTLPAADPVDLAVALGAPEDLLVALDFDGTLAPIVDVPTDATLEPGAVQALRALSRTTIVAILSGRDIDDLRTRLPDLNATLIGGHGAQMATPRGERHDLVDVEAVSQVIATAAAELAAMVDAAPGWLLERKPTSIAVHHRLVPPADEAEMLPRVRALLDRHAPEPPGFEVLEGKSVLELRPLGVDKGTALARLLLGAPARRPLVIGDDVTDEDAFDVAVAHGGWAVLVDPVGRATNATHRLDDPSAVITLLAHLTGVGG